MKLTDPTPFISAGVVARVNSRLSAADLRRVAGTTERAYFDEARQCLMWQYKVTDPQVARYVEVMLRINGEVVGGCVLD